MPEIPEPAWGKVLNTGLPQRPRFNGVTELKFSTNMLHLSIGLRLSHGYNRSESPPQTGYGRI
jgi:hypothetical protein